MRIAPISKVDVKIIDHHAKHMTHTHLLLDNWKGCDHLCWHHCNTSRGSRMQRCWRKPCLGCKWESRGCLSKIPMVSLILPVGCLAIWWQWKARVKR